MLGVRICLTVSQTASVRGAVFKPCAWIWRVGDAMGHPDQTVTYRMRVLNSIELE